MTEIQIQSKLFQYVWNKYPETRRCFFHVPNGGTRNKIEATQLKASGLVAGIPDMILAWDGSIYGIEVKTPTGKLSDKQVRVRDAWELAGNPYFVIRSVEEGIKIISRILNH